jgi:thiol-disulfide isomerase/thioredoxin
MKKSYLLLFPLILLLGFCTQTEQGSAEVVTNESENGYPQAPSFSLEDLKGNTLSFEDFRDKVVIVNFWATWCPPCRAEIPGFIEAYEEYRGEGLEIIGLSLDQLSPEKVLEFANGLKVNYPIAMATEEIYEAYQPGQYIPSSIIIDKKGKIRHRHVGYLDKSDVVSYFHSLISE